MLALSKTVCVLIFFFAILMLLNLYEVGIVQSSSTTTFKDWSYIKISVKENLSISLALPSDWKIEEKSLHDNIKNAITISPSSNLPSLMHPDKLTVGIEEMESEIEPSTFSKSAKQILSSRLIDFELIDSFPINITDLSGERILFNHKANGQTMKVLQTWIIDKKTAFIITFATIPDRFGYYNPLVNKIISSLAIDNGENKKRSDKPPPDNSNYSLYRSQVGFELSYPKDWTLNEGNNQVSFISRQTDLSDSYLERLDIYYNISYSYINKNNNLTASSSQIESEEMSTLVLEELEYLSNNLQDFNLISINDFFTSNIEGKEILYTYNPNVGQTKVNEYLLKGNSTFVILTFSADAANSEYELSGTIESILNSFRFPSY